jgi:uncharacterized membrane protein
LGNTVSAYLDAKMAASSKPAYPRDWRRLAWTGGICFAAGFAVFTISCRSAASSARRPSPRCRPWRGAHRAAGGGFFMFVFRTQALQLHNLRIRVALDKMSQGLCRSSRSAAA